MPALENNNVKCIFSKNISLWAHGIIRGKTINQLNYSGINKKIVNGFS